MSDFFTSLSPHFHATMRLRYVMFFCIVKESIRSPSRIVFTISRFHVHIYVISRCFCMNHNISLMKSWKQENTKMATWNHTTWKFENVKSVKPVNSQSRMWTHQTDKKTMVGAHVHSYWSDILRVHTQRPTENRNFLFLKTAPMSSNWIVQWKDATTRGHSTCVSSTSQLIHN